MKLKKFLNETKNPVEQTLAFLQKDKISYANEINQFFEVLFSNRLLYLSYIYRAIVFWSLINKMFPSRFLNINLDYDSKCFDQQCVFA